MDDLEDSPLLRVFNRKEKPPSSSRNVSASRLSRKKEKCPENRKPLRTLQSFSVSKQTGNETSSHYGAVYENGHTVSCSVDAQKKEFIPKIGPIGAFRGSSDSHNSVGFAQYEYVNNSDLSGSGKLKSSSKTESVGSGNSLCENNESEAMLTSSGESNDSVSDSSDIAVNIHEELVADHLTLSNLKREEFINSSQMKNAVTESLDMMCVQQNDCDIVTGSYTFENQSSDSDVNQTIEITSDKSSDRSGDDICKYLQKLEVCDDPPNKTSAFKVARTPKKIPSSSFEPSSTKKLQVLQSFFSSDEDYSPPPLSKRLAVSAECTENTVPPVYIKKKKSSSSEYGKKGGVLPSAEYVKKDVISSTPGCVKKGVTSSSVYDKQKDISPQKNIRELDFEVSSSAESGDESDEESGSGSEDFEQFLVQLKTPLKKKVRNLETKRDRNARNLNRTEQKEITNAASSPTLPKSKVGSRVSSNQPSGIHLNNLDMKGKEQTTSFNSDDNTDSCSPSESSSAEIVSGKKTSLQKASFLASLSADVPDSLADPRALMYRKQFMKKREELVEQLFALYNHKVFNCKLPQDMKVTWNPNLTKTAGKCFSKKDSLGRVSWIELAPKILDSADRVRDTLVHEMCHAACWLVHGNRGGHGSLWKFWASRVQQVFPDIPPVRTCHGYEINTKYVYVCTGCGGKIGRHSKSIDVTKVCCSRCKSKFELVVNGKTTKTASRPATGFALFVKENYGNLKKQHAGAKHGDIMKMLSTEFALKTKISS